MNSVYRSVWNGALGAWVAVSEVASGRGKGGGALRLLPLVALATLFIAAGLVPRTAQAAVYTVSDEAGLVAAINAANADGDVSSTIRLGGSFTIGSPALIPVVTKSLTINPGAHTLSTTGSSILNAAPGATLTVDGTLSGNGQMIKAGAGTVVLTGTGSSYANSIRVDAGALRVQDGGKVAFGGLALSGDHASVTISGAGSLMDALGTASRVGSQAGSTLTVENGGEFRVGNNLDMGIAFDLTGTLIVRGANSRVSASGFGVTRGTAFIYITDGGQVSSASLGIGGVGSTFAQGGTGTVVVSGAGSRIDTGQAGVHGGSTLSILDGGVVATTSMRIGIAGGRAASVTVSGAGAELTTSAVNDLEIARGGATGTLTLANGGQATVRAGAGTLNIANGATSTGTLNIGGAVGQAAQAAGVLNAARVLFGGGTGLVNFNHTDAAHTFAVPIAGNGGVLQSGPGTTVLMGANTYTGATQVNGGTLRAGGLATLSAASAHTVGAGGTLDLAGFSHTLPSMDLAGQVSTVGTVPGTTLTVNGLWQGNGGTLRLGTALNADGSASDRLVLNGPGASAAGRTTLQIANLGGLGAQTTGDGIEVITAQGGATSTAQTTRDAFALKDGHVDAGAYEYHLFAADAVGVGENWFLRSTRAVSDTVMYRAEVPLLTALPEQLRQSGLVMLGNLHQRMGDDRQGGAEQRHSWARLISTERQIAQGGVIAPVSHTRFNGLQAGIDLWTQPEWRAGLYLGQLEGNSRVRGFSGGIENLAVGGSDLRSRFLGLYATHRRASGLYADAVLQVGSHSVALKPKAAPTESADSEAWLASLEVGQAFHLGSRWQVEPQLQLVYQRLDVDAIQITNADVQVNTRSSWLARAGVRVKTSMSTRLGVLQPYGRLNVYHASSGSDITRFGAAADATSFATRIGGTSTEAAIGMTLEVTPRASVYAELGRLWASGGDSRSSGGLNGSAGLRWLW